MNKELETRATQVLDNHALRKTAMRMDVLQVFLDKEEIALSNQELEAELEVLRRC